MKLLTAWCVLAVQVLAAAEGPENPAVRYLEKVRDGVVNLEPGGDTALAAQTVEEKRAGIAQRIKRLSSDLGKLPLVAGASRVDGDLAAVMVGQTAGNDFDAYQVTAVALVKRGDAWLPAPLPGSYQNAGLSYEAAVRERAKRLEDWMVEQKGPELESLRARAISKLRHQIEEALPVAEWKAMSPSQCVERFFKACETGQLPVLAGLLGGLTSPLPDDWGQCWKVAGQALESSAKVPRQWRLLMAPGVLRIPLSIEESGERRLLQVACLDPAGVPPKFQKTQLEEISLELVKSADGLWTVSPPRVDLPPAGGDARPAMLENSSIDVLTEIWADRFPPSGQPDPRAAADALLAAFRSMSPSRWVSHLKPSVGGDSMRRSLEAGGAVWRAFCHPPSSRHAVVLGGFGDERHQAFVFQVFSVVAPDQLELREVHFVRTDAGWFWEPCPADGAPEGFERWKEQREKDWSGSWRSVVLKDCVAVDRLAEAKAPTSEDARAIVERWSRLIRQGNLAEAIGLTARLRLPDSEATLLRNLGYEVNSVRNQPATPAPGGVLHSGPWALVPMTPVPGGGEGFSCFPVIQTAVGPRILLEMDLAFSESRGRKYLNSESLARLAKSDSGAAAVLKELFSTVGRSGGESPGN